MHADELIYWASIDNPAVKMASLNGTGQVTLLNESKASYSGITLYRDSLYISDEKRRSTHEYSATSVIIVTRPLVLWRPQYQICFDSRKTL